MQARISVRHEHAFIWFVDLAGADAPPLPVVDGPRQGVELLDLEQAPPHLRPQLRLGHVLHAHSGEIDHPFRLKSITHSGRNRSPVRSEATRDLNHESRFSRFFSPPVSGVIAWNLPSCRVVDMVFVSTRVNAGKARRGRPRSARCSSGFDEEGRWVVGAVGNRALCGFPSSCGRVLCVHRSGGVHSPPWRCRLGCVVHFGEVDHEFRRKWTPVRPLPKPPRA